LTSVSDFCALTVNMEEQFRLLWQPFCQFIGGICRLDWLYIRHSCHCQTVANYFTVICL